MNVGLAPNDTRLEVIVDYGSKDEAPVGWPVDRKRTGALGCLCIEALP